MYKEYDKNEKKEEKGFKKFKKALIKIGVFAAALGVFSMFSFPIGPLYSALSGIIGETMLARTIALFTQIGCVGASLAGIIVNGIKANKAQKEMEKAKENNYEVINKVLDENEEMKGKLLELEKDKSIIDNSKGISKEKVNINYKDLVSIYEKQTLENLRLLNTDNIKDDKEDLNEYNSILNELTIIKDDKNLSDEEKYNKVYELYGKTLSLIESTKIVEKSK